MGESFGHCALEAGNSGRASIAIEATCRLMSRRRVHGAAPRIRNRSKILFTPGSTPKPGTSEAGGYRNALLRTALHLTEKILGRSLRNRGPPTEGGTMEVPNEKFISPLVPFCS